MLAQTQQALAGLIGGAAAQDIAGSAPVTIAGDGAIDPTVSGLVILTKGSAAAITIAAPGAGGIGITKQIVSDSAFAHVITFTGNTLRGGTAAVATATFGAFKGCSITIYGINATEWAVLANVVATLA